MKKYIFILLLLPIFAFGQQAELWEEISTLTEFSQKELLKSLKSNCIGSSYNYTTFIENGKTVEISYDNHQQAERVILRNFTNMRTFKGLLVENNTFIPIRGFHYYKAYYINNDLTLIREQ